MARKSILLLGVLSAAVVALTACQVDSPAAKPEGGKAVKVLAAETFLADIAQNVAGDRVRVEALIPLGVDPHGFEPTPQDVRKVAESDLLLVNGAGFEAFVDNLLDNAGGTRVIAEASAGLTSRTAREGEAAMEVHAGEEEGAHEEGDPHFWLDPVYAIRYVENIRDALSQVDPEGKVAYARNAEAYIVELKELDGWIAGKVAQVPQERRLLVTNHESFGYFADRYGFRIAGTVIPSVSTAASPSAQQLAKLVDVIRESQAAAIFLETGANSQLAEQLGRETGARVVTGLLTHSITTPDGPGPDYLTMMRYNVETIVGALE